MNSGHRKPELPESHYLDNRIYTDEAVFRDEQERIFGKVWQFVCHESEFAANGDFRTTTIAGKPIVIVRGQDGVIRERARLRLLLPLLDVRPRRHIAVRGEAGGV